MAAPMKNIAGDPNVVNMKFSESSEETDICSPYFNPLSALYADEIVLPFEENPLFNNLAEFENALKKNPDKLVTKPVPKLVNVKKRTDILPVNRRRPEHTVTKNDGEKTEEEKMREQIRLKRNRNVLTRMERYEKGPYNYLLRCVKEQHQVAVWTRGAVDVRGVCKGFIVAFDKHFNLAMLDVDEVYRSPLVCSKSGKRARQVVKRDEQSIVKPEKSVDIEPKTKDGDPSSSERISDSGEVNIIEESSYSEMISKTSEPNTDNSDLSATKTDKCEDVNSLEDKMISLTQNLALSETKSFVSKEYHSENTISDTQKNLKHSDDAVCDRSKAMGSQTVSEKSCQDDLDEEFRLVVGFNQFMGKETSKIKLLKRHVNQMFIRGDNVVSIAILK